MSHEFRVHSANLGGGKAIALQSDDGGRARAEEFVSWVRVASADVDTSVAMVQEITSASPPEVDLPAHVAALLGDSRARQVFTPTVTTARYPLDEKWGPAWRGTSFRDLEEGLATFCLGEAEIDAPSASARAQDRAPNTVLDLPIFEFDAERAPDELWLAAELPEDWPVEPRLVYFRPSYYKGTRDTDPRLATAHRLRWPGERHDAPAECVVINLHLGTLTSENRASNGPPVRGAEPTRVPTAQARFLRWRQLDVVRQYVEHVYRVLHLPVVVAGDFNAEPSAPELAWFCSRLGLSAVFSPDRCWRCDAEQLPHPRRARLFTSSEGRAVLAATEEAARERAPGPLQAVDGAPMCRACDAPLFSHKFHLQLLDNVLYTRPPAAGDHELVSSLRVCDGEGAVSIDLDTSFSDHLPITARMVLERR